MSRHPKNLLVVTLAAEDLRLCILDSLWPKTPFNTSEKNNARERSRSATKIFQGFGGLSNSHKDFAFNNFLLLYYSQILGVPASTTSIVLALCLLADAITDPMVGAYLRQLQIPARPGRHPFMYAASVPLGLFMYLLFTPPAGASELTLVIWLFALTLATRTAFTFFIMPWNAVAAEYSDDYVERTSIITYRYVVGWIGGVIFSFGMYTFVFASSEDYPAGQLDPGNYPLFAMITGGLITLWCLVSTHMTRREVPYLLQPVERTPKFSFMDLARQVLLALQSRNFRLIFISMLFFAGIAGVGGVFDMYMNTYFWEFKPDDLPLVRLHVLRCHRRLHAGSVTAATISEAAHSGHRAQRHYGAGDHQGGVPFRRHLAGQRRPLAADCSGHPRLLRRRAADHRRYHVRLHGRRHGG